MPTTPDPDSTIVDLPTTGTKPEPASILADAVINGNRTTIRTTPAEAKARGYTNIRPLGRPTVPTAPEPRHKSRTAKPPKPPKPPESAPEPPDTPEPDEAPITPEDERRALHDALNGFTMDQLREQADDRGLEGVSRLRKDELIAVLIETAAEEAGA